MKFLIQVWESFLFAYQALRSNILRTTLSLLGVSVGIFAIVAVFTAVDSLNKNIRSEIDSFSGAGVFYLGKWPWIMENNYPWWKYFNRPDMKYSEFKYLKENLKSAQAIAIIDNGNTKTASKGSNSMDVNMTGASYDYNQIANIPIASGRYFLPIESENGMNVCIIGSLVAENLQLSSNAVGEVIKLNGIKFTIIGVIEKKGTDILSFGGTPDEKVFIPYSTYSSIFQKDRPSPDIALKAFDSDLGQLNMEGEVTGLMRGLRSIKPKDELSFSVNRLDGLNQFFDGIFAALNIAGSLIAGFSLLVGGFGIANIMFVSVKERTQEIGIQKALGAKKWFIQVQFLFESIWLCLAGGFIGMFLVWVVLLGLNTAVASSLGAGASLTLGSEDALIGIGTSVFVGIVSGLIPAISASNLDPVIAIRAK